jgi:hypothetical protein
MKAAVGSFLSTAFSTRSRSNHGRVLLLAIVGWIVMIVAAVAVTFFQSRSGGNRESISTAQHIPPTDHISRPPVPRTQSCSTSNCHGAMNEDPREDKIRSDEYFVWLDDPHARAFRALSEERSRKIFRNLGVTDEHFNPLPGQVNQFEKHWRNCLGCHETNEHLTASTDAKSPSKTFAEGVSCESCHGNAAEWLHQHYRTGWRDTVSNERQPEHGFIGTKSLSLRIKQCSTCHVGSSQGEVNHDLIAAGHPALRFEYVWYQSRLPKHWKTGRDVALARSNPKGNEKTAFSSTHTWVVGQLVTSIASLEQLERRMTGEGFQATVPELAEYNCFACHHDLQGTSWRRERGLSGLIAHGGKKPRLAIPWGNWNLGLISLLADQSGTEESRESSAALHRLRNAIQASTTPSQSELVELTSNTRHSLEHWLKTVDRLPNPDIERLVHQLGQHQPELLISDWDQTANILLGFAATYRSANDFPAPLKQAMDSVRFPDTPQITDSPEQFLSPDRPPNLTAAQWIDLLKQLSDLLAEDTTKAAKGKP